MPEKHKRDYDTPFNTPQPSGDLEGIRLVELLMASYIRRKEAYNRLLKRQVELYSQVASMYLEIREIEGEMNKLKQLITPK